MALSDDFLSGLGQPLLAVLKSTTA